MSPRHGLSIRVSGLTGSFPGARGHLEVDWATQEEEKISGDTGGCNCRPVCLGTSDKAGDSRTGAGFAVLVAGEPRVRRFEMSLLLSWKEKAACGTETLVMLKGARCDDTLYGLLIFSQ